MAFTDQAGSHGHGKSVDEILLGMKDEMRRNQAEMHSQIRSLQNMNSQLLRLVESNAQQQQPQSVDRPPPLYPRGQCTYFFRIFEFSKYGNIHDQQVVSPDFYLNHLGFRAFYFRSLDNKDLKEFGICLTYFGYNGPSRSYVKVRASVRSDDPSKEDAPLGEFEGVVDISSKESMATWTQGFVMRQSGSHLKKLGAASPPFRVLRFDIDMQ